MFHRVLLLVNLGFLSKSSSPSSLCLSPTGTQSYISGLNLLPNSRLLLLALPKHLHSGFPQASQTPPIQSWIHHIPFLCFCSGEWHHTPLSIIWVSSLFIPDTLWTANSCWFRDLYISHSCPLLSIHPADSNWTWALVTSPSDSFNCLLPAVYTPVSSYDMNSPQPQAPCTHSYQVRFCFSFLKTLHWHPITSTSLEVVCDHAIYPLTWDPSERERWHC